MTIQEALKILTAHNKWRRGEDVRMQDPKDIGLAIDVAIGVLSRLHIGDNNLKKIQI